MTEIVVGVCSVLVGVLGIGKILVRSYVKAHERAMRAEKGMYDLMLATFKEDLEAHKLQLYNVSQKMETLAVKYDQRNLEINKFVGEFKRYIEQQEKRLLAIEEQFRNFGNVTVKE